MSVWVVRYNDGGEICAIYDNEAAAYKQAASFEEGFLTGRGSLLYVERWSVQSDCFVEEADRG